MPTSNPSANAATASLQTWAARRLAGLRPPYHLGRVVAVGAGDGGRRRVRLEAAAPAAAARQRLGSGPHRDVADLAAGAVCAGIDPAVEGEAAGDAGADGHEQHPSGGPARAEPGLGQRARAHVVTQRGRQAEPLGDQHPAAGRREGPGWPTMCSTPASSSTTPGTTTPQATGIKPCESGRRRELLGRAKNRVDAPRRGRDRARSGGARVSDLAGLVDQGAFDAGSADVDSDRYSGSSFRAPDSTFPWGFAHHCARALTPECTGAPVDAS